MTRRAFKIFTVDAFTNKPYCGNSATVVFLDRDQDITDELKQRIANEMSFSETAFVSKKKPEESISSASDFFLRWFTPKKEVPLCGHATLATAAALFDNGNKNKRLSFDTKSGTLTAIKTEDGKIMLNLPARMNKQVNPGIYDGLFKHVIGERLEVIEVRYSTEEMKLVLRLKDNTTMKQLENFSPNFDRMMAFSGGNLTLRGVTVTLKGSKENGCVNAETGEVYDFVSRHFAPWYGVPEDPVTGSAHTVLGPYWSEQLGGKTKLFARQASKRGGDLYLTVRNDHRIEMGGHWVCVRKGELYV
ncbi:phenazine biosynthesis-like domain-containing protein isoform X1 [Varroa jacobsoni]|uniref:Phenazine biosynthesis-like domain-containing protein n=1 Tax=Varroa destructor TaxID=109461 RepID=A0A7M7K2U0_VARDE|nr:phenazine biosynthesis-like domain-containing protein [Varroa destructor]XP_022698483.1 phenazine biosynthesis-like domain-containing protein isoform X1 [Varroa jacobsoni]